MVVTPTEPEPFLDSSLGVRPPKKASRLRARRKDVIAYNKSVLGTLRSVTRLEAVDYVLRQKVWKPDPKHLFAWEDEEDCGGLPTHILLGTGAEVILRSNIDVRDGLTNGARGVVEQIISGPEVLVRFSNPQVGAFRRKFSGRNAGLTPIAPVTVEFMGRR